MTSSVLVNDNHRSEIVIYLRKGKRFGPIMSEKTGNKENVSPQGMDAGENLSDHFQKGLTLNGVEKDGRHFLNLMEKASDGLARSCIALEKEMEEKCICEEACGKIRAVTGKAKLLINKKFKQFRGLCEMNLGVGETNGRRPTNGDLEGFWDMVMIQVEEVFSMFSSLEDLRRNGWVLQPSTEENELTRKPSLKKSGAQAQKSSGSRAHVPLIRQKSKEEVKAAEAEHRAAARQRLAAAKRMAKMRMQNKQNGNKMDEVEIYY